MDVAKLLIRDLDGRGLVDGANLNSMTVPGPYCPFVTEFGRRLLEFIAE